MNGEKLKMKYKLINVQKDLWIPYAVLYLNKNIHFYIFNC